MTRTPARIAILPSMLALLALAMPAPAADLAGTTWDLGGSLHGKIRKVDQMSLDLSTAEVLLEFHEDGTCLLTIDFPDRSALSLATGRRPLGATTCPADLCVAGRWHAGKKTRFTVDFNEADLVALLQPLALMIYRTTADVPDVRIRADRAKGKVAKDGSSLRLKVKVKARVRAVEDPKARKFVTKIMLTGHPAGAR